MSCSIQKRLENPVLRYVWRRWCGAGFPALRPLPQGRDGNRYNHLKYNLKEWECKRGATARRPLPSFRPLGLGGFSVPLFHGVSRQSCDAPVRRVFSVSRCLPAAGPPAGGPPKKGRFSFRWRFPPFGGTRPLRSRGGSFHGPDIAFSNGVRWFRAVRAHNFSLSFLLITVTANPSFPRFVRPLTYGIPIRCRGGGSTVERKTDRQSPASIMAFFRNRFAP